MKKLVVVLALFALVPFALAACGGDDDNEVAAPPPAPEVEEPAPEPEAETVRVTADPDGNPAFEEDSLEVRAGEVTFEFDNPAAVGHDFVIEDAAGNDVGRTDVISDDTDTVTVDLEPGEYTFYCSVPGHREGGMAGTLTVDGDQDGAGAVAPEDDDAPGY